MDRIWVLIRNKVKEIIKRNDMLYRVVVLVMRFIAWIPKIVLGVLLRTDKQTAVFISAYGKSYSCNPRAVSEALHELAPDFRIVWLFREAREKRNIVPDYVHCVEVRTLRAFLEQIRAGFWIDNHPKPYTAYKKDDQTYIQLWHGDRGFKRILYDDSYTPNHLKFYVEQDICDLMISGSDYRDKVIKSAFRYNGEVMKVGCPRNDLLLHYSERDIVRIKRDIGLPTDKKILLYAPTFRRSALRKKQELLGDIDLELTLMALEHKTNEHWICLVRAHKNVEGLKDIPNGSGKIIDVTRYEDMRDLLLITDLLVTDYSSSAGDFALLKRPIFLYQPDQDKYVQNDRLLYFDVDVSPFTVVHNQKELLDAISNLDLEAAEEQCEHILRFYGTVETGHAARSVAEYIVLKSR